METPNLIVVGILLIGLMICNAAIVLWSIFTLFWFWLCPDEGEY